MIGVLNNVLSKYILSPNEHQDQYIVGAIINNLKVHEQGGKMQLVKPGEKSTGSQSVG